MTNSSRPPTDLKGKGNPDLPSVCSNYWPPIMALSLCFNHLVLSTFWQCRSAIPKRSAKPIASIHHTVEYPSLTWLRTSVNLIPTRGADYAHHITACPFGFENLTTSLLTLMFTMIFWIVNNVFVCTWRYICFLNSWSKWFEVHRGNQQYNLIIIFLFPTNYATNETSCKEIRNEKIALLFEGSE